jgi:hypothetical protein
MKKFHKMELKSPSIPLFQRGKLTSPPFGKGRQGGIFKALKYYNKLYFISRILDLRFSI